MAYAQWLQVVACQSPGLDDHTLARSVEAFLEAMSGSFTLLRDGILNFQESDVHTEPLELQGPFKEILPAFQDLFGTLEKDPLAHILVMHQVQTDYQVTVHLHDLLAGMLSRQVHMGELQPESFKGVAICSVKGASERAVIGVLGLITGRSFELHLHDWPVSDPMDTGCPSPGKALPLPAAPSTHLQHDSLIDIRLHPSNLPDPLIPIPLPMSLITKEEQALLGGPPICQSQKKQMMSLMSNSRTILKRKKKTPQTYVTSKGIPYDEMGTLTWTMWRDTGSGSPWESPMWRVEKGDINCHNLLY